jgi:group I intron endonuclease
LHRRFCNYFSTTFLRRTKNNGMIISKALLKYGYSAFSLSIIEYIDINNLDSASAKKLILEREEYYLNKLNPDYNILKKAGSSLGYKHSEENLALFKMPKTDKHKENITKAKIGTFHTEETKLTMSIARKEKLNPFYGKFIQKIHELKLVLLEKVSYIRKKLKLKLV